MMQREAILTLDGTRRAATLLAGLLATAARDRGILIGLSGELGGGKTTFVRELCIALGVTAPVSSPTFVLQHSYGGTGGTEVDHWDLYRLKGALPDELFERPAPRTLRLIEWIERSAELVEAADIHLTFHILGENQRKVLMQWKPGGCFDTLSSSNF